MPSFIFSDIILPVGGRRGGKKGDRHGSGKNSGGKGGGRWGPPQGYGKGGYGRNEMSWEEAVSAQAYHHNMALQMQMQSFQTMPLQMQGATAQPPYLNAMVASGGYGFPAQHPASQIMISAPPAMAMAGPAEVITHMHVPQPNMQFPEEGDNPDTMFSPGGVMRFE
jgi:hypothetical protein